MSSSIDSKHHDEFLKATSDESLPVETFDQLNLLEDLLRGVYAYGFETPSAIQKRAITPICRGEDLIAQAQSGTGKTATFAIGCLQRVDFSKKCEQVLILCPTRELADQSCRVIADLGTYLDASALACIGGRSTRDQMQALRDGVHIVSGTPGRVYDMIMRGALDPSLLKVFVLDEADKMLSRGFKDQIYEIFKHLPEEIQTCLFSATMPSEALEITELFMQSPTRILIENKGDLTLEGIQQFYIALEKESWKLETLFDLYDTIQVSQCIIFCNTIRKVTWLVEKLEENDFVCSSIHGGFSQEERESTLKEFRAGASRILVATDVLARGIDVHQVSLVINMELPMDREDYIHRIGRAGRFGRKGMAINFVTPREYSYLKDIEDFYATNILELPADFSEQSQA